MSVLVGAPPAEREPDYEELESLRSFWKNHELVVESWVDRSDSVQLTADLIYEMASLTKPHEHHPSGIKFLQFVSKDSPKRVVSVPVTFASIQRNNPDIILELRAFGKYKCVMKIQLVKGYSASEVHFEIHNEPGWLASAISSPWVRHGGNQDGISDCDLRVVLDRA